VEIVHEWTLKIMMKWYCYSRELLTFVEVRWLITRFVIVGILMGIVILFGIIKLNQSIDNFPESRPPNMLAAENNFLRQHLNLISARADKLEVLTKQLNERSDNLHLLFHRTIVGDTVSRLMHVAKVFKSQPLIPVAKVSGMDFN
jgi:hypothetical protein